MRTSYLLPVLLAIAAVAALVTGFILSENGIELENFNYLPSDQSGAKSTSSQNPETNNNFTAVVDKGANNSD
jgi:hypothetical protein